MSQVRVRKRGKTFSYIFEAGKIEGRRKVVEKGGYPTKDAAYKAGVEAYNDFIHGNIGITSTSIKLADFMQSWLTNVVALNVRPSTMQTYQSLMNNQILPHLGGLKIQELSPAILDKWLRSLQKVGLSRNTLRNARDVIGHSLDYAVYPAQLISSNPANYIKVPKNAPSEVIERSIIMPEQFRTLLEKYPFGTPYYIPLLILYYTGVRCGELIGLTWNNVNFRERTITIKEQITYLHGKGYFFSAPKTPTSIRSIVIDDFLVKELWGWQKQQIQNEDKLGDSYVYSYCSDTGALLRQSKGLPHANNVVKKNLVCTRENGSPILHFNIVNLLKKNGLNAHSFRHTHATLLMENGAMPKEVSARLGHSNVYITQDLYTHITAKMSNATANIFSAVMQTNY